LKIGLLPKLEERKMKTTAVSTRVGVFEDDRAIQNAVEAGEVTTATEANKLPVPPKEKAKKKKRDFKELDALLQFPATNEMASFVKPDLMSRFNELVIVRQMFSQFQEGELRINAMIGAKEREGVVPTRKMVELYNSMVDMEIKAEKVILEVLNDLPVWTKYLIKVKGCAARIASAILVQMKDISRFATISALWSYAGLTSSYVVAQCAGHIDPKTKKRVGVHKMLMSSDQHHTTCPVMRKHNEDTPDGAEMEFTPGEKELCGAPLTIIEHVTNKAPKRRKGYQFLFNTKLKTACWKLANQFVKQGSDFYKEIYRNRKALDAISHPDYSKGHINNMALRKLSKIFLANLWLNWRGMEGLPIRAPYALEYLGHTTLLLDPAGNVEAIKRGIEDYNRLNNKPLAMVVNE
jgi:hypothetical protein